MGLVGLGLPARCGPTDRGVLRAVEVSVLLAQFFDVGVAGVRVPDMGGEELHDAALGVGIGRKQRREPSEADPLGRCVWRIGEPGCIRMEQRPYHMNGNVTKNSFRS